VIILPNIILELPLSMYFLSEIHINPSKIAMKLNATAEPPQREGLSPLGLSNQWEGRGGGESGWEEGERERGNETKKPKVIS